MAVSREAFGTAECGTQIYRYYISNGKGFRAGVINYGAILVNLFVPDKTDSCRMLCLATIRWSPTLKTAASSVP